MEGKCLHRRDAEKILSRKNLVPRTEMPGVLKVFTPKDSLGVSAVRKVC
jgi:hypothetical protein